VRLYYASLFSTLLWVIYCVIVIPLFWLVWAKLLERKVTLRVATVSALVIAMLPWTEELWIAFRFSQLCREDAGVFINKTVEVTGFYDDTAGWGPRQIEASGYQFVESRDTLHRKLLRVERADDTARKRALDWYARNHPGMARPDRQYLVEPLSDDVYVAVSPNGIDAWRVASIQRPSARYRYEEPHSHTPVAYRITKIERVVLDTHTGEVLGRETRYARRPYWFFVSLDAPLMLCPGPQEGPPFRVGSIYNAVLKPASHQ
jgi:hypothetical protein